MKLQSIQTGRAVDLHEKHEDGDNDTIWTSGIFKQARTRPVQITGNGIIGDEQADLTVHGGPDKAICVYPEMHFAYWNSLLDQNFFPGAFGENFTVLETAEDEACIGDIYAHGRVRFQITQPRQPCWKLARRWSVKELPALVQKTGKTGWYFRVLESGKISAPCDLERIERPHTGWTVTRANSIMYDRRSDPKQVRELAELEALSASWRESLMKRLAMP